MVQERVDVSTLWHHRQNVCVVCVCVSVLFWGAGGLVIPMSCLEKGTPDDGRGVLFSETVHPRTRPVRKETQLTSIKEPWFFLFPLPLQPLAEIGRHGPDPEGRRPRNSHRFGGTAP